MDSWNLEALILQRLGLPRSFWKKLQGGRGRSSLTGHASYDVSPDGKKFLMIRNEEGGLTELRVVLNFAHELKALVPPK